jgi:hypothetical protein
VAPLIHWYPLKILFKLYYSSIGLHRQVKKGNVLKLKNTSLSTTDLHSLALTAIGALENVALNKAIHISKV